MREILFKGKKRDNGEWVYGDLCQVLPGCECKFNLIFSQDECATSSIVLPETVGQYIGLIDKNGKKIFEGDVCKFREWDNGEMCWIGHVHFEHCQFIISGGANKECPSDFYLVLSRFSPENIEVIGNVHDNPELLEEVSE